MQEIEPGSLMLAEMAEQPGCVAAALGAAWSMRRHLADAVQAAESVVFLGRGSSRSAATYGVHAVRSLAAKPAFQLSPAELAWGTPTISLARSLVVVISQSGESQEVLAAAEQARAQGARLLVITNSPNSPLAALAGDESNVLECHAGVERAVPATKSFTTSLACLLAIALADGPDELASVQESLPDLMQRMLAEPSATFDLKGLEGFVMAGEGFAESVAEEGAIKVRETMRTLVASLETSELLHGSVNSLRLGNGLVTVAADGLGSHLAEQAVRGAGERGATTVYIGPDPVPAADWSVQLPAVAGHLVPFLAILPIQQAARSTALSAGLNPDSPFGLNKITLIDALHQGEHPDGAGGP